MVSDTCFRIERGTSAPGPSRHLMGWSAAGSPSWPDQKSSGTHHRESGTDSRLRRPSTLTAEAHTRFSGSIFVLLTQLRIELDQLSTRIEEMDALIARTSKENDACQRLTSIPGVGPVTATALVAAIGNGSAFRKGRDLAAWVGLVPREYSTGGKQRLLGISKQGNSYLRRLFVQCARSILRFRERQGAPFGVWLTQLMSRSPQNVVVVALANKLVRTAWAVLFNNEPYRSPMPAA